ncbi:MAG: terminase small subunit [Algoriphagus aquaeductus]|uniref:terminase small subunit n=1 Tax=Algoriphagus aquaeductus TaxID=475299 RepID=UPI00387A04B3
MRHQIQADKEQIELTDKEYRFANYYLGEARFNATEAAKLAGYSERTARQQGYENLTKPYIKKYIQERSESILEKLGATQERILAEIVAIAFSNVTDLFEGDWQLKKQSDIPKASIAAVKNLAKTETGVKVEMHDKLGALLKLWELVKQ